MIPNERKLQLLHCVYCSEDEYIEEKYLPINDEEKEFIIARKKESEEVSAKHRKREELIEKSQKEMNEAFDALLKIKNGAIKSYKEFIETREKVMNDVEKEVDKILSKKNIGTTEVNMYEKYFYHKFFIKKYKLKLSYKDMKYLEAKEKEINEKNNTAGLILLYYLYF